MSRQATRPDTMIPTRRRFLAIVGAGAVSTAAPAAIAAPLFSSAPPALVATPSPDAVLLKLIDDYWTAKAEANRAFDVFTPFEERSFARKRQLLADLPEALRARPEDLDLNLSLPITDGFYGLRSDKDGPFAGQRHLGSIDHLRAEAWDVFDWEAAASTKKFSSLLGKQKPSPAARARADEILRLTTG
jgi:hypothetical protein